MNNIDGNGKKEYGQYLQKVDDLKQDLTKLENNFVELNKNVQIINIIKESGCQNLKDLRKVVYDLRDSWMIFDAKKAIIISAILIIIGILATLGGNWIAIILWGKAVL